MAASVFKNSLLCSGGGGHCVWTIFLYELVDIVFLANVTVDSVCMSGPFLASETWQMGGCAGKWRVFRKNLEFSLIFWIFNFEFIVHSIATRGTLCCSGTCRGLHFRLISQFLYKVNY